MGADHILFGSDYPHPEGLAEPCSYVDHLPSTLSEADVARIMGGNLAEIMRVEYHGWRSDTIEQAAARPPRRGSTCNQKDDQQW